MVLMCDFDGYVVPEIVKNRHVVVLSSKGVNAVGTTLVVPISSKRPNPVSRYHVHFPCDCYDCLAPGTDHWAKGNLIAHVRLDRLDRVKAKGVWCTPLISEEDFRKIQGAIKFALTLT
jgi:uncharacterized protein YifN (PemK superfamily)